MADNNATSAKPDGKSVDYKTDPLVKQKHRLAAGGKPLTDVKGKPSTKW